MSSALQSKNERINLRLKQSAKQLLERAAGFEGESVSSFILSSALARAERTVQQHEVMSLNAHDSEKFFNALAAPIRFNSKLLAAFEEYDQRVNSKSPTTCSWSCNHSIQRIAGQAFVAV